MRVTLKSNAPKKNNYQWWAGSKGIFEVTKHDNKNFRVVGTEKLIPMAYCILVVDKGVQNGTN